jgi:hypothetical protein
MQPNIGWMVGYKGWKDIKGKHKIRYVSSWQKAHEEV